MLQKSDWSATAAQGLKPPNPASTELFRQPLIEMLTPKHPLVKLADVID